MCTDSSSSLLRKGVPIVIPHRVPFGYQDAPVSISSPPRFSWIPVEEFNIHVNQGQ
jgi:hypothetical protein